MLSLHAQTALNPGSDLNTHAPAGMKQLHAQGEEDKAYQQQLCMVKLSRICSQPIQQAVHSPA